MEVRLLRLFKINIPDGKYRQILYALAFTLFIHLIIILLFVSNISWTTSKPSAKTIDVVFTNAPKNDIQRSSITEPTTATPLKSKPEKLPPKKTPAEKKPEPKPDAKTKPEAKTETKPEQKAEPKIDPKAEIKTAAKVDEKKDTKPLPQEDKKKEPVTEDLLADLIVRSTETVPETKLAENKAVVNNALPSTENNNSSIDNSTLEKVYIQSILGAIEQKIVFSNTDLINYKVKIIITQDKNGKVLSVDILEKSKAQAFDEAVVRGIYAASPLPLPNKNEIFQEKIVLNWRRFKS